MAQSEKSSLETDNLGKLFKVAVAKEPINIILIEKNLQRLRILELTDSIRVVEEFSVATGENPGCKQDRGDSRTPEGIYFITRTFIDDRMTIFGDKAFHLDYPNHFDLQAGRSGDGIYIHGTNRQLQPYSTNGCIALNRVELDELGRYITEAVTPVVIVPDMNFKSNGVSILTENNYRLAKTLLHGGEPSGGNIVYNTLYVVNFGDQAVAVGDYNYTLFRHSMQSGAGRVYLQYSPEQGWTAEKSIRLAGPLHIVPDKPVKVLALPRTAVETYKFRQASGSSASLAIGLEQSAEPDTGKNKAGRSIN